MIATLPRSHRHAEQPLELSTPVRQLALAVGLSIACSLTIAAQSPAGARVAAESEKWRTLALTWRPIRDGSSEVAAVVVTETLSSAADQRALSARSLCRIAPSSSRRPAVVLPLAFEHTLAA